MPKKRERERPAWPEYFMFFAAMSAMRSTCLSRKVGAVLVREGENRIITTAYNGQTPGSPHCSDMACLRHNLPPGQGLDKCRVVHAEQNVMTYAAKHGIATDGAVLYCTHYPCYVCAKNIVCAGIRKVVFLIPYPSEDTAGEFTQSGVKVVSFFDLVPYNNLEEFERRFISFLSQTVVGMRGRSSEK